MAGDLQFEETVLLFGMYRTGELFFKTDTSMVCQKRKEATQKLVTTILEIWGFQVLFFSREKGL